MAKLYDITTNAIGSILGVFSPPRAIRYRAMRQLYTTFKARSYAAAQSDGPNQLWAPANMSADSEIWAGNAKVLARARDLARNNEYVAGAVQTVAVNVVRQGINPQPLIKSSVKKLDARTNQAIIDLWAKFVKEENLVEKTYLAVKHLIVDGEGLGKFVLQTAARKFPLRIQMLESDQLDPTKYGLNQDGTFTKRGITLNTMNDPVRYWLYDYHPGDSTPFPFQYESIEVQADQVMHWFRRDRASQTRGISWLAPIINLVYNLGEYKDYEMIGAKVAAAFGVFIKSPFADPFQASAHSGKKARNNSSLLEYLEPGRIERLLPGEEIQIASHSRPGNFYTPFVSSHLRGGSVGFGMSYESFSGDYSQSTYSSARSALLEERRKYRMIQCLIVDKFLQPIYEEFLKVALLRNMLPYSALRDYSTASTAVRWKLPGWEWVDPLNDAQAAEKELSIGTTTREKILAGKGEDFDDTIEQLAYEENKADDNKVKINGGKENATTQIPQQQPGVESKV